MRLLGRCLVVVGASCALVVVAVVTPVKVWPSRAVDTRALPDAQRIAPSANAAVSSTVAIASASPPTSGRATASRAPAAARSTPASRSSRDLGWERFGGQVSGASHIVATARGASLDVSLRPDEAAATTLSNPTALGAPRVVLVTQDRGAWLQVLLPMRPNASLGWIRRDAVEVSTVPYRVDVDRSAHRLHLFNGDALVLDEPVAVGRASTPTPPGQFFTVELLQPPNPHGAYGPFAFSLSAYSDVYQTFGSGDGAVGLHGTNEPSSIGRDASHGCIRVPNQVIEYLARVLPIGTPVFIR